MTKLGARYLPAHINLETSDLCNRGCAFCPIQASRDGSPARLMDMALFERVMDELAAWERELTISLQWIDEPLANPAFFSYASAGVERLPHAEWVLQTNGDFLDAKSAARLGELFGAVVVNLYSQSAARRLDKLGLELNRALGPQRIQHPGRLRGDTRAGARARALFHFNHKYKRDDWIDWKTEKRRGPGETCTSVFEQVAIGWDGQVYACCRDNLKAHPVGDLRREGLAAAYNSAAANALRHKMQNHQRAKIDMCRSCDKAFQRPVLVEGTAAQGLGPRAGGGLPLGSYTYLSARTLARELGHLALPGFLPRRYEYVVGLSPELADGILSTLRSVLGDALHCVWICGGRVMARQRLALVDPSVFMPPAGTLTIAGKGRVREYGRSAMRSSDLDLKVFVDDDLRLADQDAVELALGAALEDLGAPFPISGNPTPRVRLLSAPRQVSEREAFSGYNAARPRTMNKGPLSLAYTQLLATRGGALVQGDPRAPVRGALVCGQRELAMDAVQLSPADDALTESACFEREASGLSYHQLVTALMDFPELDPSDLVVDERGRVVRGGLSVRATRAAGRTMLRR